MNATGLRRIQHPGSQEVYRLDLGSTVGFLCLDRVIEGRTFGGIRIREYPSEELALADAVSLARAMTRKVVLAGIRGGGAKAVVIRPRAGREECLKRLGECVESLGGRYHCGGDLGFTPEDDRIVRKVTRYIASGDLSEAAARGVRLAMEPLGMPRRVAVQGLGAVGRNLALLLKAEGIEVIASDLLPVDGFAMIDPDRLFEEPCDVFAPCAVGEVLSPEAVSRLASRAVCGAANNPLTSDSVARLLEDRGITYVPDFVANMGATIVGASRVLHEEDHIEARMNAIPKLVASLLTHARSENTTPLAVAQRLAEERVRAWG